VKLSEIVIWEEPKYVPDLVPDLEFIEINHIGAHTFKVALGEFQIETIR
jgi:hypothetical protein